MLNNRVDPAGYPAGPPTDPDVQISRIRLLETRLRCATHDIAHPTVVLSDGVALRCFRDSAIPTSFPPFGSVPRSSLPSTGSLGSVPRLQRYYEAL